MVTLAFLLLWLLVLYLAVLGAAALLQPARALAFLSRFAQSRRVNTLEASLRMAVGVAFIVVDAPRSWNLWGLVIGSFLLLSGVVLLLAPDLHKRLAPRLVSAVQDKMLLLGAGALLLAAALGWALS